MLLTLLQEKMIFMGVPLSERHDYRFSVPHSEYDIEAPDGGRLNALYFGAEDPRGLIVYFHGNAGNLQRWGQITSSFTRMGYDIVVMDYRGYGKSKGERNEEILLRDALLFYRHSIDRFGYPEDKTIVYGRSLGSSFATYVASVENPARLVLETPFYNLVDVARSRFPVLPVEKILKYAFPSDRFIESVRCPLTIYHGTRDRIVPHKSGYKLFKKSKSPARSFFSIKGGSHHNLSEFPGYFKTIESVLNGEGWRIEELNPLESIKTSHES